jgi:hypothetical protein
VSLSLWSNVRLGGPAAATPALQAPRVIVGATEKRPVYMQDDPEDAVVKNESDDKCIRGEAQG